MQEWIHGPFNFHEIKQNQNPLHRACSFTSFHRIILKITSRVRTNVRLLNFLKKIITHFWCKQASPTSLHSSQTDFSMHKQMRRPFNFYETKEYQDTLLCI